MKNNNTYGYGFKSNGSKGWYSLNAFQWRKSFSYRPVKEIAAPIHYTVKTSEEKTSA